MSDLNKNTEYFIDDCERVRAFALELYASPEHWGTLLQEAEHYAYIFHDKDVKEDGSFKTPHYHLLLRFPNAKTKSAVRKLTTIDSLDADTTINFQRLINSKSMYQYLMHNTKEARDAKKTPYDESLVIADDKTYWNDVTSFKSGENEAFLEDLLNPQLSQRAMAVKYGRDYIRNYTKYNDFALVIQAEKARGELKALRDDLFNSLGSADNAYELSEDEQYLHDYIAGLILDLYYRERQEKLVSLSDVANGYFKILEDSVLSIARDKI